MAWPETLSCRLSRDHSGVGGGGSLEKRHTQQCRDNLLLHSWLAFYQTDLSVWIFHRHLCRNFSTKAEIAHVREAWWVAWSNFSPNQGRKGSFVRAKMESENKPYKKWGAEPKLIYLLPTFTVQGTFQVQDRQESGYLRIQTAQPLFHYLSHSFSSSFLFVRGLWRPFSPSGLLRKAGTDAQLEHGPASLFISLW